MSNCSGPKLRKSVCIWSYSGPYFPAFGLNTERYRVSPRIQSECRKIWPRITPNTDTYAVLILILQQSHGKPQTNYYWRIPF